MDTYHPDSINTMNVFPYLLYAVSVQLCIYPPNFLILNEALPSELESSVHACMHAESLSCV